MCGSKLHECIQVSGFQVEASSVQSSLLQGNTRNDAASNFLLISSPPAHHFEPINMFDVGRRIMETHHFEVMLELR